jgi:hypothetical protein
MVMHSPAWEDGYDYATELINLGQWGALHRAIDERSGDFREGMWSARWGRGIDPDSCGFKEMHNTDIGTTPLPSRYRFGWLRALFG